MGRPSGPMFLLDVREVAAYTTCMTTKEIGAMFKSVLDAAQRGDLACLAEYEFVTKWKSSPIGRSHMAPSLRKKVLAYGRCRNCASAEDLEVDHIKPVAKGGRDDEANLQVLCGPCNRRKGAKWPIN